MLMILPLLGAGAFGGAFGSDKDKREESLRRGFLGGLLGGGIGATFGLASPSIPGLDGGGSSSGGLPPVPDPRISASPIQQRQFAPQVSRELAGINLDVNTQGLEQLRREGTAAPGTSAFARLGQQIAAQRGAQERDAATQAAASQQATSLSNLAQAGGLSQGARERVLQSGQRPLLDAFQQAGATQTAGALGAAQEAERLRQQQLQALPGQELALGRAGADLGITKQGLLQQARLGDEQRRLAELEAQRQIDLANQRALINLAGTEREAQAFERSSNQQKGGLFGGGGFLGLGL